MCFQLGNFFILEKSSLQFEWISNESFEFHSFSLALASNRFLFQSQNCINFIQWTLLLKWKNAIINQMINDIIVQNCIEWKRWKHQKTSELFVCQTWWPIKIKLTLCLAHYSSDDFTLLICHICSQSITQMTSDSQTFSINLKHIYTNINTYTFTYTSIHFYAL